MMEKEAKPVVYSVDFDGTLAVTEYPKIIKPIHNIIEYCKQVQKNGDKLILNTCRTGDELLAATVWCALHGLEFDAVNENLPERIEEFGGDCRKISADYYIDDRNIHPSDVVGITQKNIEWWEEIKK